MANHPIHFPFAGRLVMLGFGSIGRGVLPLLERHLAIDAARLRIVAADAGGADAEARGIAFDHIALTPENYRETLLPLIGPGDVLLNLSVDVSSLALIEMCAAIGAIYLDTCIEPWAGGYADASVPPAERTNYALRENALAVRRELGQGGPTAVLTHGANPGLVSHFVKVALLELAKKAGLSADPPASRGAWALLAEGLGVEVIHVSERDWQIAETPKAPNEFVNTWSVDGFIGEGSQPAELGWGTHEKTFPDDAMEHEQGSRAAIFLNRPGALTRVRTWTPLAGEIQGFLITHGESISIADFLTVQDAAGAVRYRPTVHYAYHPCNDAILSLHELAGRNLTPQDRQRILMDEIVSGADELGVLLAGRGIGAYWYGSRLDISEARRLVPDNNATSLQVAAAVLGGLVWALENPSRGIVEPEDMDHVRILEIAGPYLGPVAGVSSDWTPTERHGLFSEEIDEENPWQFANVRVN
jgi:homospermidine synthase